MPIESTSSRNDHLVAQDGPAPLDWAALRSGVADWSGRLTGPDRTAVGVVLVHLIPVAWLVTNGGLYLDDLRAQAYARGRSIWPFIIESNGTHLAPGARVVDWLQARYWPLEQWPATVMTLLLHLALGAALWLLLRELVGPRPGALVALALGILSPAVVPTTAWFRQMLTTGTVIVCSLFVVLAAVRYAKAPGMRRLSLVPLPLIIGLLFSERALATASATVVTVLLLTAGPLRRRIVVAAPLTVVLMVITGVYLAVYARGSYDTGNVTDLTAEGALRMTWRAVVLGVVPALLGGPLAWRDSGPAFSVADTAAPMVVFAWVVVASGAFAAARQGGLRPRVLGPGLAALAYVVPVLAMVFVGRYSGFGAVTGDDLRLFSDCAIALLVAGTVAVLGVTTASPQHRRATGRRARLAGPAVTAVTAVTAVAVAFASAVSWAGFADRWHTNASPTYLRTLDSELDRTSRLAASPPSAVVPTPVPDDVIPGWFEDELTTADLVLLTHPDQDTSLADGRLLAVDETGRLRPIVPVRLGSSAPPTRGYCGTSVPAAPAEPVTITLGDRLPYYRGMLLSVQVLTLRTTVLDVDVVDGNGTVRQARPVKPATLGPGPHTVLVPVPFGVDVTAVRVHPGAQRLCVPRVTVFAPRGLR